LRQDFEKTSHKSFAFEKKNEEPSTSVRKFGGKNRKKKKEKRRLAGPLATKIVEKIEPVSRERGMATDMLWVDTLQGKTFRKDDVDQAAQKCLVGGGEIGGEQLELHLQ